MNTTKVTSYDAGVDYVTLTTSSEGSTKKLVFLAEREIAKGGEVNSFRFRDYHGRRVQLGNHSGGLAYGVTACMDRGLLQAWGLHAERVLWDGFEICDNVNRIDFQISALYRDPQPKIRDCLDTIKAGVRRLTAFVPIRDEGGTLYVGSPKSDKWGRIYDKGVQLGTVPPCLYWRYEVRYYRDCAKGAAELLWLTMDDPERRARVIAAHVVDFFDKVGVFLPLASSDNWRYPLVRWATRVTSDDKTLRWLREQVHPALVRLQDHGLLESALNELRLPIPDTPYPLSEADDDPSACLQMDFLAQIQEPW